MFSSENETNAFSSEPVEIPLVPITKDLAQGLGTQKILSDTSHYFSSLIDIFCMIKYPCLTNYKNHMCYDSIHPSSKEGDKFLHLSSNKRECVLFCSLCQTISRTMG